jgi:hypothetical protein
MTCQFCGHNFDGELLGAYGCPNCEGEPLGPRRIQCRRTKGWRKPAGAVYVGRPGKWGNPIKAGRDVETRAEAVAAFRRYLPAAMKKDGSALISDLGELRGRDLMCWCPIGAPCHADVLLEVANALNPPEPLPVVPNPPK